MSGIGKTVIRKLAGKDVVCRELPVGVVRGLLSSAVVGDLIDEMLFEDVRLVDLPLFTGLSAEDIEQGLPSELALVVEGCMEANPDFFGMLARYNKVRRTA